MGFLNETEHKICKPLWEYKTYKLEL